MTEMTTQLAVFLKNVPGALHEMLRSLAEGGVNIEGIMVNDAADHAVVRLVVDAPPRAIHLLGERGAVVVESEIVSYEMPNQPGELLRLAGELARHEVNIAYLYGSTARAGGVPRIFIHSGENERVFRLLSGSIREAASGGRVGDSTAAGRGKSASRQASRERSRSGKQAGTSRGAAEAGGGGRRNRGVPRGSSRSGAARGRAAGGLAGRAATGRSAARRRGRGERSA